LSRLRLAQYSEIFSVSDENLQVVVNTVPWDSHLRQNIFCDVVSGEFVLVIFLEEFPHDTRPEYRFDRCGAVIAFTGGHHNAASQISQ
jgi:hypothetical protein